MDAADLHDDVLLAPVHVGHHPVLARSRKRDAGQDLPRPLVARMKQRRAGVRNLLNSLTVSLRLDQQVPCDHLDGVAVRSRLGIPSGEQRVISERLWCLANRLAP